AGATGLPNEFHSSPLFPQGCSMGTQKVPRGQSALTRINFRRGTAALHSEPKCGRLTLDRPLALFVPSFGADRRMMTMLPGWVLTIFLGMAALVPAGVYFTATLLSYTYSGYGTGTIGAAPGPLLGAGIIPALIVIGAAYRLARRSRRGSLGE